MRSWTKTKKTITAACVENQDKHQVAFLVGSATVFPLKFVGDFDVIFIDDVKADDFSIDQEILCTVDGRIVEYSTYPPSIDSVISQKRDMNFFLYREIKKILNGLYISGNQSIFDDLCARLKLIRFPKEQLFELISAYKPPNHAESQRSIWETLRLFYLVSGYLWSPIGPLKMKWIYFIPMLGAPWPIKIIIDQVTDIYKRSVAIGEMKVFINRLPDFDHIYDERDSFLEAARLIDVGAEDAAYYPFFSGLCKLTLKPEINQGLKEEAKMLLRTIDESVADVKGLLESQLSAAFNVMSVEIDKVKNIGDLKTLKNTPNEFTSCWALPGSH